MPLVLSGDGAVGPLSATEVSYLDGVTSAVQTQLNGKAATPGAWSSYTPELTATTTNPTLGTGATQVGDYVQIGKVVIYRFNIVFGTSGNAAGSGTYRVSLPVASKSSLNGRLSGNGAFIDASANSQWTFYCWIPGSVTTYIEMYPAVGSNLAALSGTSPVTVASSDQYIGLMTYEAA